MVVAGTLIGLVSFFLALDGWPVTRLWLYLLGGSMLTLLGVQLFIFWVIVNVLAELSQRDAMVEQDMTA